MLSIYLTNIWSNNGESRYEHRKQSTIKSKLVTTQVMTLFHTIQYENWCKSVFFMFHFFQIPQIVQVKIRFLFKRYSKLWRKLCGRKTNKAAKAHAFFDFSNKIFTIRWFLLICFWIFFWLFMNFFRIHSITYNQNHNTENWLHIFSKNSEQKLAQLHFLNIEILL